MYEHPVIDQAGNVVLTQAERYALRVGGKTMSCPQDWASAIHREELQTKKKMGRPSVGAATLPSITVPEELRDRLQVRAVECGLSMPDARREAYYQFIKEEEEKK